MSQTHSLPAEVTIYTLGVLHPQWLEWLAVPAAEGARDAQMRTIDASSVDQIDAAGVQWLLSLSRSLSRDGGALQLTNPSSVLVEACETLGVAAVLLHETTGAAR